MKEKTVKSPGEQGEYLIYEDIMNDKAETPCVSVSFRKTVADGTPDEYDFEHWKTFMAWEEAEAAVEAETGRSVAKFPAGSDVVLESLRTPDEKKKK